PTAPSETLPHNGVTRTPAFLRSEFCQSCHQFTPEGFALNGKLLENTYAEWKASRFAREGVQCQDCHMPDRRHLWRGIHDPEMVRSGLTIDASAGASRYRPGERVVVYPDEFYARFFESLLAQGAGRGEAQIHEALTATRRSPFTVFDREIPLT